MRVSLNQLAVDFYDDVVAWRISVFHTPANVVHIGLNRFDDRVVASAPHLAEVFWPPPPMPSFSRRTCRSALGNSRRREMRRPATTKLR